MPKRDRMAVDVPGSIGIRNSLCVTDVTSIMPAEQKSLHAHKQLSKLLTDKQLEA